MRRAPITRLGLVASLALIVAACGGGGTSGSGPSASSTGSLPKLNGQSVTAVAVWTGGEQTAFQQVLAGFNQATGANASYQSSGTTDMTTFLGAKIQGGNPPDVAMLPNPGLVTQFANQGALKPIENIVGSALNQDFDPYWRQLGTVNGTLYGFAFKVSNKSTFWYNSSVFSQAGVQPPADWPGLLQTAGTISDFGTTPFAIDGGSGWPLTDWFENVYLRTAGADMYDKLTQHQIKWTDPSVQTALQTMVQAWKSSWILGGASGSLQSTFPDDTAKTFSTPPQAAMTYEGNFVQYAIPSGAGSAAFFNFPSINGSPPAVIVGADTAVLLKDTPGGRALIQYLATPAAAGIWAKAGGGYLSPNKMVPMASYADANTQKAASQLTSAQTLRFDMSDLEPASFGGTTGQGEFKAFQDLLRNPTDISGVMSELETAAAKAFT